MGALAWLQFLDFAGSEVPEAVVTFLVMAEQVSLTLSTSEPPTLTVSETDALVLQG